MRPNQIFAGMTPEATQAFFDRLSKDAADTYKQAVYAAAAALNSRPQFLTKLSPEKRAANIRRALSRVQSSPVAEEILAVYFLEVRKELLAEWLDMIGLAHEEGILEASDPPQPAEAELKKHFDAYMGADDDPDRGLLLKAFAAQSSIEWPALDALNGG